MLWSRLMDALPFVNLVMSTVGVGLGMKIVFSAGRVVQHLEDLDARVKRLEERPRGGMARALAVE